MMLILESKSLVQLLKKHLRCSPSLDVQRRLS